VIRTHQGSAPALRRGYWMQFWAALYAVARVYPQPRLTAFTLALVGLLAVLIIDTAPTSGWSR